MLELEQESERSKFNVWFSTKQDFRSFVIRLEKEKFKTHLRHWRRIICEVFKLNCQNSSSAINSIEFKHLDGTCSGDKERKYSELTIEPNEEWIYHWDK